MKNYNEILRELREDKDLKQEDLANILKCTKQAYGNYENKKRNLPIENLKTLCLFYNVSADYILGLPELPYPKR